MNIFPVNYSLCCNCIKQEINLFSNRQQEETTKVRSMVIVNWISPTSITGTNFTKSYWTEDEVGTDRVWIQDMG